MGFIVKTLARVSIIIVLTSRPRYRQRRTVASTLLQSLSSKISFLGLSSLVTTPQMASSETATARFDLVIFGASGFTGQYVVEDVIQVTEGTPITWAVAGRNTAKLEQAVKKAFEMTGKEPKAIPIIVADVSDDESIDQMCQKAKLIINTVGPYRFYGEGVVKACIKNKTHHIDISGEPLYLEKMQLEQNEAAKDAGVYIVGATGFDSIPIETGLHILRKTFPGDISYVETYISFKSGPKGTTINHGTWDSAVYGIGNMKDLKGLRKELLPEKLPKGNYPPPHRKVVFYSDVIDGWCLPFMGTDKSVATRTQYYLYNEKKIRPFYIAPYVKQGSLFNALATMFVGLIVFLLSSFEAGRKLLVNNPKFFTFGTFTKEGPTREQVKDGSTMMTLVATGHRDKLAEVTDVHTLPPDTKLTVQIKGPDAGYTWTSMLMVQCGLTILQEQDKLPKCGGVYPPGVAFMDTTLIERLEKRGTEFVIGEAVKIEH